MEPINSNKNKLNSKKKLIFYAITMPNTQLIGYFINYKAFKLKIHDIFLKKNANVTK